MFITFIRCIISSVKPWNSRTDNKKLWLLHQTHFGNQNVLQINLFVDFLHCWGDKWAIRCVQSFLKYLTKNCFEVDSHRFCFNNSGEYFTHHRLESDGSAIFRIWCWNGDIVFPLYWKALMLPAVCCYFS